MQDETPPPSTPTPETPQTPEVITPPHEPQKPSRRIPKPALIGAIVVVVVGLALASYFVLKPGKKVDQQQSNSEQSQQEEVADVEGLQLDPNKNYGDKYANGILPVGDNQYATSATKGKVYLCKTNFVSASQAGASTRGPWFVGTTQWDINKKYAVRGSVNWQQKMSNNIQGDRELLAQPTYQTTPLVPSQLLRVTQHTNTTATQTPSKPKTSPIA